MSGLSLDHVGIAVADLDGAARNFRALGFTLTDKSFHVAAPSPGAAPVRTGTGNHCIMLGRGYLELIAVTDAAYAGRLRADLARYEGLHLIAFGTDSAADTAALFGRTTGKTVEPRRLARPIEERGIAATAAFDIIDLPEAVAATGHLFAIQHLTPDVLWQPHLTAHDNGAVALLGVIGCAEDPGAFLAPIAAAIDAPLENGGIAVAGGRFEALAPAALARRFPGAVPPALPSYVGLTIGVRDLGVLRTCLTRIGAAFGSAEARLWVPPSLANGAILEFTEMR